MSLTDFSQLTPFEPIDVIGEMRENILVQYKDSPNLLSYIEALLAPFEELENVFIDVLNLRLLSLATGSQLDILGELVDQPRGVYNTNDVLFFGMDPIGGLPVTHGGLGEIATAEPGGILRDISQPVADRAYLDDTNYRKVILAKAWKNSYLRSVENLIIALQILFELEVGQIEVVSDFTAATDPFVTIKIGRELTLAEKSILQLTTIVPEPAGHRYEYEDTLGPI